MSQYASRADFDRAQQDTLDRGAWIQTFSGRRFYYEDPRPEDIHIVDIAHALSNICRYAGHANRFYSVAEHSVIMSGLFTDPRLRLVALLHDATEAYVCDLPRPLKRMLPGYMAYEDIVWGAVAAKFGLPKEIPELVHEVDTRMLMTERPHLFRDPIPWPKYENVRPIDGVRIECWSPGLARIEFLCAYQELARLQ